MPGRALTGGALRGAALVLKQPAFAQTAAASRRARRRVDRSVARKRRSARSLAKTGRPCVESQERQDTTR
jgi:hypothetical protein